MTFETQLEKANKEGSPLNSWIDDYLRILTQPTISLLEAEHAKELKASNLPNHIYKFRGVNENSLENLANDTVWTCSGDKYNDPYECFSKIDWDRLLWSSSNKHIEDIIIRSGAEKKLDADELKEVRSAPDRLLRLMELLASHDDSLPKGFIDALYKAIDPMNQEKLKAINEAAQRATKISSFSSRNDSILMWGHYADCHRGFCVEYEVDRWPEGDARRHLLYPVIYANEILDITDNLVQGVVGDGEFNNLFATLAAIHKAPDWSYECEWRIVIPLGDPNEDSNLDMPRPSAVYLGTRIRAEDEDRVRETAEKKSIPVRRMQLADREFRVIAEDGV